MANPKANTATDNAISNEKLPPVVLTVEYYDPQGAEYQEHFDWTLDENWEYDRYWGYHFPSHFKLQLNEDLAIADQRKYQGTKQLREKLKLKSRVRKNNCFDFFTSIHFAEKHHDSTVLYRKFKEKAYFSDSMKYYGNKVLSETFNLFDTILRPANGVLSDIIIEEGDWNVENVAKYVFKGKPAGYTFFKPFVFGEYRYKSALFRTSLDATKNDALYMEEFKYSVDVPDVVDRGSSEVLDKNFDHEVKFNKHFSQAPEVTVSIHTGTTGETIIPTIVEITKNYFKVRLTRSSDDTRTTGRFIWTAIGY